MARAAQRLVDNCASGVTVLAYHLVAAGTDSPVDISLDHFVRDMDWLRRAGRARSLTEAATDLRSGSTAGHHFVVTFDDAFDNFREQAWPVLHRLGIPATLYVPVGFLDRETGNPLQGGSSCGPIEWCALRELSRSPLLTVGSHSYAHENAVSQDDAALIGDAIAARGRLESELEREVEHYCYPRALWDRRTKRAIGSIYSTAVVAGGRVNTPENFDPQRIYRVPIRRGMPPLETLANSRLWIEEALADVVRRGRAQASRP